MLNFTDRPPATMIINAAWADRILDAVAAGDQDARAMLDRLLPERLSATARNRLRNERLHQIYTVLISHFPGETRCALAHTIARLGAAVEGQTPLTGTPWSLLGDDLGTLVACVRDALRWLPRDPRTESRWPCERTIRNVL
jgi:hypothetical protein